MTHGFPRARPLIVSVLIAAVATAFDALLLALALGGPGALAAHSRALALLAIWAVGNTVLAVRQPRLGGARTEPQDEPFAVLVALFLLPFGAAPLAAWGARAGIAPLSGGALLHGAGLVLVALGLALRLLAMVQLGRRFTPRVAMQPGHELETGGLYGWVRHPGYLGALIAALGGALTFGSGLGLIPVALLVPALMARMAHEDRVLEERFGDSFRAWRGRTGGLLPRLGGPR